MPWSRGRERGVAKRPGLEKAATPGGSVPPRAPARMAPSVQPPTLDFGSGHDVEVVTRRAAAGASGSAELDREPA